MALNQKTIYVYESFNSDESNLMGILYVGEGKGSDNFSFEFLTNLAVLAYFLILQSFFFRDNHQILRSYKPRYHPYT